MGAKRHESMYSILTETKLDKPATFALARLKVLQNGQILDWTETLQNRLDFLHTTVKEEGNYLYSNTDNTDI
jgi:hypothetical protein